MKKLFTTLLLFTTSYTTWAGLPPTTSKATGDATDITTFKFRFPNFTVTHVGTQATFNVNSIAGGGTGQATKAAGFDALSPMTTSGDIIYGAASGTGTRLAKGSDGQVLTLASGIPSWAPASSGNGLRLYGTCTWQPNAGCTWATSGGTSGVFQDFLSNGSCLTATCTGGLSAPGTNVPEFVMTSAPAGTYQVIAKGWFIDTAGQSTFQFSDGTNTSYAGQVYPAPSGLGGTNMLEGSFVYGSSATRQIKIQRAPIGSVNNANIQITSNGQLLVYEVWSY